MNAPKTYGLTHLAIAVKDIERTLTWTGLLKMTLKKHKNNIFQCLFPLRKRIYNDR